MHVLFRYHELGLRAAYQAAPALLGLSTEWLELQSSNMSGFIVVNIYVVWAHKLMRFWSRLLRHQLRTSPFLSEIVFSLKTHHPNQCPQ